MFENANKMKTTILPLLLILTLLTQNHANPIEKQSTYDLKSDLHDFFKMIPTYELLRLYHTLSNEKYVMDAFAYFKSADVKSAIEALLNLEELQDVTRFMENENIPLHQVLNETVSRFGYEWWQTEPTATETTLQMKDFLEDATKIVNAQKIGNVFLAKYLNSNIFNKLVSKIQAIDTAKLQSSAAGLPIVQRVTIKMIMLKVDMKELFTFIALQFLGDNLN